MNALPEPSPNSLAARNSIADMSAMNHADGSDALIETAFLITSSLAIEGIRCAKQVPHASYSEVRQ